MPSRPVDSIQDYRNRRSPRKISINNMFGDGRYFFDCFDNYIYGIAESQDAQQLAILLNNMPFLMEHGDNRRVGCDSEYLPLIWAIFREQPNTNKAKECVQLLKKIRFEPTTEFTGRMIWQAQEQADIEFLAYFCETFGIDSTQKGVDGESHMLLSSVFNFSPEKMPVFEYLLARAGNVNNTGLMGMTALWSLLTECTGNLSEKVQAITHAVDLLVKKGASANVVARIYTGEGRQKEMPLLHAMYHRRSKRSDLSHPDLVALAEELCDPEMRDSDGRTASEYRDSLPIGAR